MTSEAPRSPESIYLDHAAATPLSPEVAAAMESVREEGFANPSSPHAAGRRARRLLDDARDRIACLVGHDLGPGVGLVFTSGATEANRLGVLGLASGSRGRVLTSPRDHSSLGAAARDLAARGWDSVLMPLLADGTLGLCSLPAADGTSEIMCVTLVCSQSGTREDTDRIAGWRDDAGRDPLIHVDATQAIFNAEASTPFGLPPGLAATLALAPHKFGGPRGIGCLLVRRDVALVPVTPGTQERGLRGGTEAVALAVGFAQAVELAVAERGVVARRLAQLRDRFEARLAGVAAALGVAIRVIGADAVRAPHISTIAFPGRDRQAVVMATDLEGVWCATGTACASGSSEPARALVAMGLPEADVQAAVRFSLGTRTTAVDIDAAVDRLARVLSRMAAPRDG